MKKNLLTIIALFVSMVAMADGGSCGDNLTWNYNSSNHTITISGTGEMYDYTSHGQPWYSHESEIQSVVISNGVTYIGENAFYYFDNVTSLSLPNTLIEIGEDAFYHCSMTSLVIPNSVTTIGWSAFDACAIVNLTVGTGLVTDETWAYSAFSGLNNLITLNWNAAIFPSCAIGTNTSLTTVVFGNQVEIIASSALDGCTSLSSVNLGSVNIIRNKAFEGCSSLQTVTWGNSLETIGESAFKNCTSLQSANLPASLTTIGSRAFQGSGIHEVTIPQNVQSAGGDWTFEECQNLTTVAYKAINCTSCRFFPDCPITTLTISDDVQTIPSFFMDNVTTLESMTMGNSVTEIGNYAFKNCNLSGDLFLSNSLITIGWHAFDGNIGLEYVEIPGGVTEIDLLAFANTNIFYVNMLPTTPPTIYYDSFPFDDPYYCVVIEVPCGCLETYTSNYTYQYLVDQYQAIIGENDYCTYSITAVSSDPSLGGVSGSGIYSNGEEATVIATPYYDAEFVSWTENGTVVSTDMYYSFEVTKNRTLTANFISIESVEETEDELLTIYPNPTNGIVNIECENMTEIEVYSCDGRLVRKSNPCDSTAQLDLSDLVSGIYLISIKNDNGVIKRSVVKE